MDEVQATGRPGIEVPGVFVGSYSHNLDPKRRLTIPSEWRDQVGSPGSLYVLPGIYERCLYVFPGREMVRRLERVRSHSLADARARVFMRTLGSRSDLVTWDTQGRIRIKDDLLEYANLTEQIVLIGAFEKFELWSPALWKASNDAVDQSTVEESTRYVGF